MACDCEDKIYTAFCGKCLPESNLIMPVEELPDLFLADRAHFYLTPDNGLYILNYERTDWLTIRPADT